MWRLYGTVFIPCESVGRRPRLVNELLEHELLNYLEERPMAYLDEIAYFLLDEYGVAADEVTVWAGLGSSNARLPASVFRP